MKGHTLHGALVAAARRWGEKPAFSYYDDGWRHLTFSEFLKNAGAVASYLKGLGTERGDRVALVAENRHEWCASYLGILMAGGVAVPVDARLTPGEIRNILTDSGARCAIHTTGTGASVLEAANGQVDTLDLDTFRWEGTPPVPEEPIGAEEDDMASLLYTSGTTGTPKGVMLTHRNLLSDARAVVDAGILSGTDRVLSLLPLHHTYAFMCTFVVPVLLGGGITYPQGLKGPQIAAAVKETGATVLVGVPQLLELMCNRIMEKISGLPGPVSWAAHALIRFSGFLRRRAGVNLMGAVFRPLGRQFRFFTSGGARLDPGVMTGLEALGFTVVEGYGLTETSPIVCFNPPERRKPGSVGRAVPGAEITILSPSPETGEGEVAVKGPMVMKGYYRRPEDTADVLMDGWFRTGDLGYMDQEGYLFITGRSKEVIVLNSGKNVYPEEVESHYLKIPLIREMCVMERNGKLHAVVVPDMAHAKEEKVANLEEAVKWELTALSPALPPHMRIKGCTLSTEPLPRTPLGKLRRFLIQKGIHEEHAPREDDRALLEDETGRKVLECLRPLLPPRTPVARRENLELDLGLDSLRRIELVVSLEREFSIKLPEGFIHEVLTVGELVDGMKGLLAAGTGASSEAAGEGLEAVLFRDPPPEEKRSAGLVRGAWDWPVSVALMGVLRLFLKAVYRLEVRGAEHLPPAPFIIALNHASYIDGFVVGAGVPRRVFRDLYFLGERSYFSGRLTSLFARLAHVITIDRDAYLHKALELSSFALRSGGALSVFPEGGRSADGELMEFKKGIGILALTLGVPVVPARLEGTYEVLPRGARWLRRGRLRLVFGEPVVPEDVDMSSRPEGVDEYQAFADEVRRRVASLTFL